MQNLMDDLSNLFKKDERIFANGKLLKNKLTELALKLDQALIELLLSDDKAKEHFFIEKVIKKEIVFVFDKDNFIAFVNNKEFLPDSFTSFKNKIGLMTNGDYLKEKDDVVLAWAYKDCVLEGGQDKEDQKRDEIFYNETLSPDEIDRLFEPKVLTNFNKYDINGEHTVTELKADDNLIIKGNNLLALHCLKQKFRGQVKLIYIDPPYNTGKDSFKYNDSFNHSSWLTFMKNRLQVAQELLASDGVLIIQSDDKEQAYVKVLLDEIFGRNQFETSFYVQVRYESKTLSEDNDFQKVMEVAHVYSKSHTDFAPNKIKNEYLIDNFCWRIIETGKSERIEVGGKNVDIFKNGTYKIEKIKKSLNGLKETWATGSLIRQGGTAAEFLSEYLIKRKPKDGLSVLYKVYNMGEDGLGYRYILGPQKKEAFRGKFYSGIPIAIKEAVANKSHFKEMPIPNLIYNYLTFEGDFGNCRQEGKVDIHGGKKPEYLLKFFIDYFTAETDLVCDYFLGSGTTAAVAHKMNRKYIGIEQLDYGKNNNVIRLRNVIKGDASGISKEINWKGGGSFVYAELMKWNELYMTEIKGADSSRKLLNVYENMKKEAFFRYEVDLSKFDEKEFEKLSLKEQKQVLCECLDKNHLYVNLSELDDATYKVSANIKKINMEFYKTVV